MTEEHYSYRAFISYRHVERDIKWARWLIEKLETYRTPRALVRAGAPVRIGHLFRDDDEIPASSDLSNQIETALKASQFLIVVCSPDVPKSKWVRKEIEFFRSIGRGGRIFALLVEGEPEQSFPEPLLRVEVERTARDGTRTTVLEDAEPIAADVRPRHDERRQATERRAFLRIAAGLIGVRYDDLAQRDRQRRVRRQRALGAAAATIVVAVSAGAYAYWDYNRIKTLYYADIASRFGVPEGIGQISAREATHRTFSYAIKSQRGLIIDVKRQNGMGGLAPLAGDGRDGEALYAGVAEWALPYPGKQAVEVDLYNEQGKLIRREKYGWQPDGSASVSFAGATGGAVALTSGLSSLVLEPSPSSSQETKSLIAQHHLNFDSEGRLTRRLYQSVWGDPEQDTDGSFGKSYSYDGEGRVAAVRELNENGQTLVDSIGIGEVVQRYSPTGELTAVEWRGPDGALRLNKEGYAAVRFGYDADGNDAGESYFGQDGKPVIRRDQGVWRVARVRDKRGNEVEARFLGISSAPALRRDWGVAKVAYRYDALGRETEESYFGLNGQLANRKDLGVAGHRWLYDQHGYATEVDYFGPNRKPAANKTLGLARLVARRNALGEVTLEEMFGVDGKPQRSSIYGFAGAAIKYDDRGNETEEDYFDTRGRLSADNKYGFARELHKFDERGNMTEVRYFGSSGEPILIKNEGIARFDASYDDRGEKTEEDYFGLDGKPILRTDWGIAKVDYKFDPQGNQSEEDYFGVRGEPVARKDTDCAHVISKHDGHGNIVDYACYGPDGEPRADKDDGIARIKLAYDDRGNNIEMDTFGTDGKPKATAILGVARIRMLYDASGNKIAEWFFGVDGRPVASNDGYAHETARYDARGNMTEHDFFGVDGKPANRNSTGFARIARTYDGLDNVVAIHTFDASGREIPVPKGTH